MKRGGNPDPVQLDDDDIDGDAPTSSHAIDILPGTQGYVHELFPSLHIAKSDVSDIKRVLGTDTQTWGSETFQRGVVENILDFASDGLVLCVHSVTVGRIEGQHEAFTGAEERVLLKARQQAVWGGRMTQEQVVIKDEDSRRDLWGVKHVLPIKDPEVHANLLRQELCANTFRHTGLLPTDFPIQSRSTPFPYKAIVFFVPNSDTHFSVIAYFVHERESKFPDRMHTLQRFGTGANPPGTHQKATLYVYDSLYLPGASQGFNTPKAKKIAEILAVHAKLFNDSGSHEVREVFQEQLQRGSSCSSWSVYFAERIREACLAQHYAPLLEGDFFPDRMNPVLDSRKDLVCAVSLLRMMIERIDNDGEWWGITADGGTLRALVASFVNSRVRFRGNVTDRKRSDALIDALVRFYTHDLPNKDKDTRYKTAFRKGDPTRTTFHNPDVIRLYILTALTVPNGVVFSTDIDSIRDRWDRAVVRYKALVAGLGTKNFDDFVGQLPSLIMWLYLPPEDVSNEPLSRKAPVLIVCRPTYSTGFPNNFARLSHIKIYSRNLRIDGAMDAIVTDLLAIFYDKLSNYTSDEQQLGGPDDVSFSPTYSTWAYGLIDVARNLARHQGYLDCVVKDSPQYGASWTRPLVEPVNGVNTTHVERLRANRKNLIGREHLWGKLMQLLTVHYLQRQRPDSTNVSTMLFNSRSTTEPVDIDTTSWRYHDVKQRVADRVVDHPSSLLHKKWAFFYYNLSFSSVVLGMVRQKTKEKGWTDLSLPCAVWLGVGAAAVLETWVSVFNPAKVAPDPQKPSLLPMPVLIQGPGVGDEDVQPVCFSVVDIVLTMLTVTDDFSSFYRQHHEDTATIIQRFHDLYGLTSGLFSSIQDPYARVTMLKFTHTRRERIVRFLESLNVAGTEIDQEPIFRAIEPYNQESFERVALVCAAFIMSRTAGP